MNERIQELMIDAELFSFDEDLRRYEKFAELIIRECVNLAFPEDSYRDDWFKAKCDVMDRIKKHFGVE